MCILFCIFYIYFIIVGHFSSFFTLVRSTHLGVFFRKELRAGYILSYSIFYPYMGMDVKIQGVPRLCFFPGVSISRYVFSGDNFAVLSFFRGWQTQKFFQVSFFSEGSNCLRLKFQIPGHIGFSHIGHPYPCMDKKWNNPLRKTVQVYFTYIYGTTQTMQYFMKVFHESILF